MIVDEELLEDIVEQCEVLDDGYVYCEGEDQLIDLRDTEDDDDDEDDLEDDE